MTGCRVLDVRLFIFSITSVFFAIMGAGSVHLAVYSKEFAITMISNLDMDSYSVPFRDFRQTYSKPRLSLGKAKDTFFHRQ